MDPRRQPVYISVDAEFDGDDPYANSMLSLGAAAYRADGKELGRFYANMLPLPDHYPDAVRINGFWFRPDNADALAALEPDRRDPKEAMRSFADWVDGFTGEPVLVAQPLKVEKKWLEAYFRQCEVQNPFQGEICMRAMLLEAMDMLGKDEPVPEEWVSDHPYTHIAIDDAVHQGETFNNIRKWMDNRIRDQQGQGR